MKKTLQLFCYYLWILLASCMLGVFVCFQFFVCTNFVAGKSDVFSLQTIIYGFFESFPVVLLFLGMFVSLYKVRHLGSPVLSAAAYTLLCAATWILLFPALIMARNAAYENDAVSDYRAKRPALSGGYFRNIDSGIYYFLRNSDGKKADVIIMNPTSDEDSSIVRTLDVSEESEFMKKVAPFSDSLIKDSLDTTSSPIFTILSGTKHRAFERWNAGILSWLCFCSLGFALCSAYSLIHISTWRLVNSFSIVCAEAFILWGNALYFSPIMESVREGLTKGMAQEIGRWHPPLETLGAELPLSAFNIMLGIIIIISGSVITILRNQKD